MESFNLNCPLPISDTTRVQLAHGGGGSLMHQLIEKLFKAAFSNPGLAQNHDSTVLEVPGFPGARLAFTTDSYVVHPLFFPGGDIGALAVNGTVNDLAMSGARPLALSAGFILEEGLAMDTLAKVVDSMRQAADKAGVKIVTGDTKVVDKGRGDGLYVNTAGIGLVEHKLSIGPGSVKPGDAVLVNGDLGRHGIAVMAARENMQFEKVLDSDCAPLWDMVQALIQAGVSIHCLRDLTRGGLSSALNEIAMAAGMRIDVNESAVPVAEEVKGACELLGFDPLYVANEGRLVAFLPKEAAGKALSIMQKFETGQGACQIGTAGEQGEAKVILKSRIGSMRVLDMLSGEQLPRIC